METMAPRWISRLVARALPTLHRHAESILPPTRSATARGITGALTMPSIYRALDVLATGCMQLSIGVERAGISVAEAPSIIRTPSLNMTRSDWITALVLGLATDGNAFIRIDRGHDGQPINLEPLSPAEVHITHDARTNRITYHHHGRTYTRTDIAHLTKLRLPGRLRGLGPIQAAMATIDGALDMRDYMAQWWTGGTGQPTGVLTTDQILTGDDARAYIRAWNNLNPDGTPDLTRATENPAGIKVLGKGLTYAPILLNPADAMWLDAQEFTTLDIARLFGTPTSLMLITPKGDSNTYTNVEQEWIGFTRFTLMAYLRPIEEALTAIIPRGQTARFNLDVLLRSDRKTRFESHKIALDAGILTAEEIRAIEGYAPKGRTP